MSQIALATDQSEIVEHLGKTAKAFEGKTILITGGRGFLGRYFTETLVFLNKHVLSKPCRIVSMDNLITAGKFGSKMESDTGVEFHQHDVSKNIQVEGKVDYILHAAGIASPYYYRAYPLETLDVAVTGTRNALEVAKEKNAKILFFSSSEIYGDPLPQYVPTPESYRGNVSSLGPRACYDESKRVGETLCRIFHTQYNVDSKIVRPFNVYGPGMQEHDYRVLPNFASRIIGKRPLKIYGSGNQTRTFCYVTDAIVGFLKVLVEGVPGEPYNIGNPKPEISMLQLAREIEQVLNRDIPLDLVEYPDSYPADEPNRRCPDINKARTQVGYEPHVELREGLQRFFKWAEAVYKGET